MQMDLKLVGGLLDPAILFFFFKDVAGNKWDLVGPV